MKCPVCPFKTEDSTVAFQHANTFHRGSSFNEKDWNKSEGPKKVKVEKVKYVKL